MIVRPPIFDNIGICLEKFLQWAEVVLGHREVIFVDIDQPQDGTELLMGLTDLTDHLLVTHGVIHLLLGLVVDVEELCMIRVVTDEVDETAL